MVVSQLHTGKKRLFSFTLLFLFIFSLPMAYTPQMLYAVATAALYAMLAILVASSKHNYILIAYSALVLCICLIGVLRDILRPYEALSIFGLYFLLPLWKEHPQLSRWLVERLSFFLIFITYAALLFEFSNKGFDLFSEKNLAGVFFERGFLAILLFLAALSLNTFYRITVLPLLIVSGSVFGALSALFLAVLVFKKLKFFSVSLGVLMLSLSLFSTIFSSTVSFDSLSSFKANLPIVKRITEGELHNINTRSLIRSEYDNIRHFYYEPSLGKLLWGLGNQNVANGVPHNKLAELGLVSFSILKFWELMLLFRLRPKNNMFLTLSVVGIWMMLSIYIFYLYVPVLFLLLAGLVHRNTVVKMDDTGLA